MQLFVSLGTENSYYLLNSLIFIYLMGLTSCLITFISVIMDKRMFLQLEQEYGRQEDVAAVLGITLRHYNRVRQGHETGSKQLQNHIQTLIKQIEAKKLMQ